MWPMAPQPVERVAGLAGGAWPVAVPGSRGAWRRLMMPGAGSWMATVPVDSFACCDERVAGDTW